MDDNTDIERGCRSEELAESVQGADLPSAPSYILKPRDYIRACHLRDAPENMDPETILGIVVDGDKAANPDIHIVKIMLPGIAIPPNVIKVNLADDTIFKPPERKVPEQEKWECIQGCGLTCYEWECPNCGTRNIEEMSDCRVDCSNCLDTYFLNYISVEDMFAIVDRNDYDY